MSSIILTQEEKKAFALEQIKEYIIDPNKCGYENGGCKNITSDGRMCVAGKNYLPIIREKYKALGASSIIYNYNQESVLIPESVNKLSRNQWIFLQMVHDIIAKSWTSIDFKSYLDIRFKKLSGEFEEENVLFSFEELMALRDSNLSSSKN